MDKPTIQPERAELRNLSGFYYDVQKLRIACGQRYQPKKGDAPPIHIGESGKKKFETYYKLLTDLEKNIEKELKTQVSDSPIWPWLEKQRGVSTRLGSVLISELDIHKAIQPSQFWHHAGMHVEDGKAPRRKAGVKSSWNGFLRTKVRMLAECLLKANNIHYKAIYTVYKSKKQAQMGPCTRCNSTKIEPKTKRGKCKNCTGTGTGPWGYGDGHRHNAALRYMVKQFLLDFWTEWRTVEGLPITDTYKVKNENS